MKKAKIFLAALLCVSLLAFAGCGTDKDSDSTDAGDGTVTEESVDRTDDTDSGNDDSVTEDMKDGAEDVKDDVEDAADDVKEDMSSTDNADTDK